MSIKHQIIYEDNHLLIINKKASQLVQADKTKDVCLLDLAKQYIKEKYDKPGDVYLGLCHRLDRPTSGIVVFARTSKALTRMNNLFKLKKVKKTYIAIVSGTPDIKETRLVDFLKKNEKRNKSFVVDNTVRDAKEAILYYTFVKKLDYYSVLKINLKTGRHHQIRAQLGNQNLCIKGDLKYGAKRSNEDASICLHAHQISFIHPVKQELVELICEPISKEKIWKHVFT